MLLLGKIGIIGGTGWVGHAILTQMLGKNFIPENEIWISSRKDNRSQLEAWPKLHITNNNKELVKHCSTIILSVRPHDFPALDIKLEEHLVISVMAGVPIDRIRELTSAKHIVRAMPNAAAEIGESYTPWYAENSLNPETAKAVQRLLETFGVADRVKTEDEISFFTALTGSGQGWIAFMEQCLIQCGINHGISSPIAERSIRQLFLGMGKLLSKGDEPVSELVKLLIDYAGTTAAGLNVMTNSMIAKEIERAIEASYQKAKSDMTELSK